MMMNEKFLGGFPVLFLWGFAIWDTRYVGK